MDYILKVVTPDLKSLSEFVNDVLLPHESVQHVKTAIVLQTLKETTGAAARVRLGVSAFLLGRHEDVRRARARPAKGENRAGNLVQRLGHLLHVLRLIWPLMNGMCRKISSAAAAATAISSAEGWPGCLRSGQLQNTQSHPWQAATSSGMIWPETAWGSVIWRYSMWSSRCSPAGEGRVMPLAGHRGNCCVQANAGFSRRIRMARATMTPAIVRPGRWAFSGMAKPERRDCTARATPAIPRPRCRTGQRHRSVRDGPAAATATRVPPRRPVPCRQREEQR